MSFTLRARVVYPVDRPPIERGVVTIEGERIVAVGENASGGEVRDLGDVALVPGLVNAHTHLEFSHLRRPLGTPGMRLVDWIRLVIAERGRGEILTSDSIATGLRESATAGVTTIGEIATADAGSYRTERSSDLLHFAEVIGFSRARAGSALAAVVDRLEAIAVAAGASHNVAPITATNEPSVSAWLGISPHAPYTVSPGLLNSLVALACERDLPVAMHLAESADELEFLRDGTGPLQELLAERSMWDADAIPRGSRPLDYLQMLAEAPRAVVIHGNYLDAPERAFLAAHADRMSLVYCPRTHAYFGHPPYPLAELLAAGVRVALGTDSRASNPDLDLLGEMRFVASSHAAIAPDEVLRMGTIAGAQALGCAKKVGSLTPGKLANLVAIPLPAAARGGTNELLSALFTAGESPSAVWVRGKTGEESRARAAGCDSCAP